MHESAQTPPERTAFRARALRIIRAAGDELLELLEELHVAALSDAASTSAPGPTNGELLLEAQAAWRLLGVGPTRFYQLRREAGFPAPAQMPGPRAEARYRRADLEAWVASLPNAARPKAVGEQSA